MCYCYLFDDNGSNNMIRGVINTRLGSHCRIHYSSFALQIDQSTTNYQS